MEFADIQSDYQYLEDENILEGTMEEADDQRAYRANKDVQYMGGDHSDNDKEDDLTDEDPSYD